MKFDYTVVYSDRKTLAISVERDHSVVVRAPRHTSAEAIARVVECKKLWIWQKTGGGQAVQPRRRAGVLVSGTSLLYLGQELRLDFVDDSFKGVQLGDAIRISRNSQPRAREILRSWYREEARRQIVPKVKFFADRLGAAPNRILISEMRFRWGSCSPLGNLNFNWRLIKAPMPVLEYVVVHELAHLLELNHTPEFWNILRIQCPQYAQSKQWLKEHGHLLEEQI